MKILAIDTSESSCSAAVSTSDDQIISRYELAPRKHSELVLPMMEDVLEQAGLSLPQLDALAFSAGPGSFTGLRIGCGVIQGAGFAADLPVIPVSTLQALAMGIHREYQADKVYVALDARMNEAYVAAYQWQQNELPETILQPSLLAGGELPALPGENWLAAGSGWAAYPDQLAKSCLSGDVYADFQVKAEDVLGLALLTLELAIDVADMEPVYLRNNVAKTKAQQ